MDQPKAGGADQALAPGGCCSTVERERRLLAAIAGGDANAFWDLWILHREHLHSVCARALGGNTEEARDALGEVMMKARNEMRIHAGGIVTPRAWLTRVTRNLCIDIRRNHARRAKAAQRLGAWTETAGTVAENGGERSDLALVKEESEIETCRRIGDLPVEWREPFELRFIHQKSCADIAAQLGLSPANVRKRLQLARACLRRSWDGSPVRDASARSGRSPAVNPDAAPSPPRQEKWEITAPTAAPRWVPVRLPCGVERHFLVFLGRQPGRWRQKIHALRAYVKRHPQGRKRLQKLAQLLYQNGMWPEAIAACRQALENKPFWLPGALLLGEMLFLMGNRDEAAAVYARALSDARQPASRRHLSGLIAGCREDWPDAGGCFQEAADQEPENPVHLHALAWAQLHVGRCEEAVQALERALRLNSNDRVALNSRRAALRAARCAGDVSQGTGLLLPALSNDTPVFRHSNEHDVQPALNATELASRTRKLLRSALRQAPHNPTVLAALARHHYLCGDRTRALALMRELRRRHPGCPRIGADHARLLALTDTTPASDPPAKRPSQPCTGACAPAGIRAGL